MLPKNSLGRDLFTRLKVYVGSEHPHAAQKPKKITILDGAERGEKPVHATVPFMWGGGGG